MTTPRVSVDYEFWTKVFFLLGLQETDQKFVVEQLKGKDKGAPTGEDEINEVVEALDDPKYAKQSEQQKLMELKVEPDDVMGDLYDETEVMGDEADIPPSAWRQQVGSPWANIIGFLGGQVPRATHLTASFYLRSS